MASTIATILINPIIAEHLTNYKECFESVCTQFRDNVYKYFMEKVLIEVDVNQYYDPSDSRLKNALWFVDYIQHDFKDRKRRLLLKNEDDSLFLDKEIYNGTQFIKRLELRKLWKFEEHGEPYLSLGDKRDIWRMLKQLWMLVQITLMLPRAMCDRLEQIALQNRNIMNQSEQDYIENLKKISSECSLILSNLNNNHFQYMVNWFHRLIYDKDTPLLKMLPRKYMGYGENIHKLLKDEDYKQEIIDKIIPVMDQVKENAKHQNIQLIEDEEEDNGTDQKYQLSNEKNKTSNINNNATSGIIFDSDDPSFDNYEFDVDIKCQNNGDLNANNDNSKSNNPSKSDSDKKRIDWIIDLFVKIMEKNQRSFKQMYENPISIFTSVMDGKKFGQIAKNIQNDIKDIHNSNSKTIKISQNMQKK